MLRSALPRWFIEWVFILRVFDSGRKMPVQPVLAINENYNHKSEARQKRTMSLLEDYILRGVGRTTFKLARRYTLSRVYITESKPQPLDVIVTKNNNAQN